MTNESGAQAQREHEAFIREVVHDPRVRETRYQLPAESDEQRAKQADA